MTLAARTLPAAPSGPDAPVRAKGRAPDGWAGDAAWDSAGLSTDYLNHYSAVLMLIEMASFDSAAADEVRGWQPITYEAYFQSSPLRRASSALAAYQALPPEQKNAFEHVMQALDRLTLAAIVAVEPPCQPATVTLIGEVIGPAIRRLIDRAAAFLNSGGFPLEPDTEQEAQAMIDRVVERSGPS